MANHVSHGHTQSHSVDASWYLDTGATDHLTSDLAQLQVQEPYQGQEQVHTANGSGMRISHVGQALLPASSSRPLYLRNVLRVPDVTKNLLVVHPFTRDNHVFVEFHPSSLLVKDIVTRDILLRGHCRNGLYSLDASLIKQAFISIHASSAQWHAHLGHPSTQIV